jgi:hypothetical protein
MKKKYLFITVTLFFILGLFASSTKTVKTTDYVIEENIEVEEWMTEPFSGFIEEPLELEEWMTKPFNI